MGNYNLKALAKKRASKDIEAEDPKVREMSGEKVKLHEKMRDEDRSHENAMEFATKQGMLDDREPKPAHKQPNDLDDHKSKAKRSKKFSMLMGVLGQMDELDANDNGIPDSQE